MCIGSETGLVVMKSDWQQAEIDNKKKIDKKS
jgi:hypothetical protein